MNKRMSKQSRKKIKIKISFNITASRRVLQDIPFKNIFVFKKKTERHNEGLHRNYRGSEKYLFVL